MVMAGAKTAIKWDITMPLSPGGGTQAGVGEDRGGYIEAGESIQKLPKYTARQSQAYQFLVGGVQPCLPPSRLRYIGGVFSVFRTVTLQHATVRDGQRPLT